MATKLVAAPGKEKTILSADEAHAFFDQKAEALLGISGQEFLRRWDAGEYQNLPESPETRDIMFLAMLIPFGRR